ncbi:MAG: sugar ABC transporter permease [Eubacteriales bacterium]|nr:sugar ABC transporter permease [Eubacteriales bacterium]
MDTKKKTLFGGNMRQNGMIIALLAVICFFGIATKGMIFRPLNISNIFMQNSYLIFLSLGMFFCVLTGNVDLSVGSVVGVSGALLGAMIVQNHVPTWIAVTVTLVVGLLIGAFQGAFIAFLSIPPFIVTLAGMLMFRGLTQYILQGQSLSPFTNSFQYFASGFLFPQLKVGGLNVICLIVLAVASIAVILREMSARKKRISYGFEVPSMGVTAAKLAGIIFVMGFVLIMLAKYRGMPFVLVVLIIVTLIYNFIAQKTSVGRHVYAVGGNRLAAQMSGVKTKWVMFIVYVNCALLATVAGIVVTGRLNVATAKAGNSYELDAIAACYIGGCAAAGGSGTIMGTIVGAAIMAILNNGMSIMGISTDIQQVIKGLILLLAVTFDLTSKSKSKS